MEATDPSAPYPLHCNLQVRRRFTPPRTTFVGYSPPNCPPQHVLPAGDGGIIRLWRKLIRSVLGNNN
ncbi:hypothetical protein KSP40_PGU022646 [Platanthera guangdongensis]|uniref:Uncharacterized protein n=1 Tax=Platanthera guangdongensis TaxID=2320717 RepID=A0ABR2MAQ7_9ASPA